LFNTAAPAMSFVELHLPPRGSMHLTLELRLFDKA